MTHPPAPKTKGRVLHWPRLYDLIAPPRRYGRQTLVRLAAPAAGESALDVGCGTGAIAFALEEAQRRCRVFGVDASPQMVERAMAKGRRRGSGVEFRVSVVEALPFPAASFDLVTAGLLLHHLPNDVKQAAFLEILRVLKPGGRILVLDFAADHSRLSNLLRRSRSGGYSSRLGGWMTEAGFVDVRELPSQHKRILLLGARRPFGPTGP